MGGSFEFKSERFLMRPPETKDARQIACCVNHVGVARNLARLPHPYSVSDAEDWIAYADKARAQGTEFAFVITDRDVINNGVCRSTTGYCDTELNRQIQEIQYRYGITWASTEDSNNLLAATVSPVHCNQDEVLALFYSQRE